MDTGLNYSTSDLDQTPVKNKNDNFEDAISDLDIINNEGNYEGGVADTLFKTSSQRHIDVNEVIEKNNFLESCLDEAFRKCEALQREIDNLHSTVAKERQRAHNYKKKLQYIQENKDILKSLKETYISYKSNRVVLDERCEQEVGTQTDPEYHTDIPYVALTVTELDDIKSSFQNLKNLVEAREESRSVVVEREALTRCELTSLKEEIKFLKLLLKMKDTSEKPTKDVQQERKERGQNTEILKKIIVKLNRNLKETQCKIDYLKPNSPLTDMEKRVIQLISGGAPDTRNERTLRRYKRSLSCDRTKIALEGSPTNSAKKKTIFSETRRVPKVYERRSQSLVYV